MTKKVALIIAYFGTLPPYSKFFFHSLKFNPEVDVILISDQEVSISLDNLIVIKKEFNELKNDIQKLFDFEIVLDTPYKLCDYKTVYGMLLEENLTNYDFWGYCDLDMVLGDILSFLPEDILNEYDKLLDYLSQNGAKFPHLKVFNPDTVSDYPYMITRISDIRYVIDVENEEDYGLGAFIDIYPFYGLGDTEHEAMALGLKGDRLSSACYQATRLSYKVENTKQWYRKILKYPAFLITKVIGKEYFQKRLAQLATKKKYEDSKYVGCVVWLSGGRKDIFLREWFDDLISVEMEGRYYKIPSRYDEILKHIYSDYMKLPPEKDRIAHYRYKIYKKNGELIP